MREWRLFLPAAVLVAGCLLTTGARRQERATLERPLSAVPLDVAGFTSVARQISGAEQRVAGMSDYLFRVFARDSVGAFSVYVGFYESQATGRTIHSPRNCLPGAGWQTVESGTQQLRIGGDTVRVNRHIVANGEAQALVYYWYQGRGRVAWSEYAVKWDLLRDAATRGRTEEALVRVIVPLAPSRGSDAAEWRARQAEGDALASQVAATLIPTVERALPRWDGGHKS